MQKFKKVNTYILCVSILGSALLSCQSESQKKGDLVPEAISLLGDSLYPRKLSPEMEKDFKRKLSDTRMEAKAHPDSEIALIWYGRRLAYLGHYQKAIEVFTTALEKHPESYKLLRHRGHRYISIRKFDRAIADLSRATVLAEGTEPQIEPDGLPNKLNQPLSTTQWNIYYHLGLAYYLQNDMINAKNAFQVCYDQSDNNDILVAATDWLYMINRRIGNEEIANELLLKITPGMEVIENDSYLKRLFMYKGKLNIKELLEVVDDDDKSLKLATQGYGVANWYLYNGDTTSAKRMFNEIVGGDNWPAFGYIAAEADLSRLIK